MPHDRFRHRAQTAYYAIIAGGLAWAQAPYAAVFVLMLHLLELATTLDFNLPTTRPARPELVAIHEFSEALLKSSIALRDRQRLTGPAVTIRISDTAMVGGIPIKVTIETVPSGKVPA